MIFLDFFIYIYYNFTIMTNIGDNVDTIEIALSLVRIGQIWFDEVKLKVK